MGTILYNLKLTWRNFLRDKLYSWVKVSSLALGIATCFLIALYIKYELSYDKHYKNTDRIYRVVSAINYNGEIIRSTVLQAPLAQTMMDEFPEIEKVGRVIYSRWSGAGSNQLRRSDNKTNSYESGFAFADQALLEVLELPVVRGDAKQALTAPNHIVITQRIADKFFPNEDAIGKSFILNNNEENPFTITAIIDDFPRNSHMNFDFIMAIYPNMLGQQTCWDCNNYHNYVLVKPGTNIAQLEEKLKSIVQKYIIPHDKQQNVFYYDRSNDFYELQPVNDIHLKSKDIFFNASFSFGNRGDIRIVWILGAAAVFILIIACINLINLSTARSSRRAKEIGFKKTIGARRNVLMRQFFIESIFYTILSIIVAIGLALLLLPYLNNLSGNALSIPWREWWLFPLLLSLAILIGVLAGIYPSLYLTSFRPVKILKGNLGKNGKNATLRNGLVVFQFAASTMLIICTFAIYRQMDYMLNKDLGFNKEQVLILHGTDSLGEKINTAKDELESLSNVQSVSISSYLPIENSQRDGTAYWKEGRQGIDPGIGGQNWRVDTDYAKTFGLEIVDGRDFSDKISSDRNAALINQEMVKQLGLNEPVGKRIEASFGSWEIIGVVKDFHYDVMDYKIRPLVMRNGISNRKMSVRVNTANMNNTIKSITKAWDEFSPHQPIRYSFLDAEYGRMYENVNRMGKIFISFSLLAIVVALLGLFGLAEYATEERIKEIGVRKVNGAKVSEVLAMLNKDFVKWVAIAFLLACPIAYYAMNKWLENFAYKTTLSWWIFALAGVLALGVALLTISWQSWRAATKNPVEALRYE